MIERKYASKQIGQMKPEELRIATLAMLLKINSTTGWNFSPSEDAQKILVDQLSKRLIEAYHTINMEEIEYAFRSTSVKDWGKSLNVSLINEVMDDYLAQRRITSDIEERFVPLAELPAPNEKMTDEEIIELAKGATDFKFIPWRAYEVLGLDKSLTPEQKEQIRKTVTGIMSMMLLKDKDLYEFTPKERMFKRYCKQYAVAQHLLSDLRK